MAKKKPSKDSPPADGAPQIERKSLPADLEIRLREVWSKVGHLLEWCSSVSSWIKMFCTEARPYRETFYWEAIAQMVSSYQANHREASAEKALTDCLIATQCPPSADDSHMIVHFRQEWGNILNRSRAEIETFKQADLDLASREGTYDLVAGLYANGSPAWDRGHD